MSRRRHAPPLAPDVALSDLATSGPQTETRLTPAGPLPPQLTVSDLCKRFDVSRETIRKWMRRGLLPQPVAIGRRLFWDARVLAEFLEARRAEVSRAAV